MATRNRGADFDDPFTAGEYADEFPDDPYADLGGNGYGDDPPSSGLLPPLPARANFSRDLRTGKSQASELSIGSSMRSLAREASVQSRADSLLSSGFRPRTQLSGTVLFLSTLSISNL